MNILWRHFCQSPLGRGTGRGSTNQVLLESYINRLCLFEGLISAKQKRSATNAVEDGKRKENTDVMTWDVSNPDNLLVSSSSQIWTHSQMPAHRVQRANIEKVIS